jgi:hypothetical protein
VYLLIEGEGLMRLRYNLLLFGIILIIIVASGCASVDSMKSSMDSKMKAPPAEGSGFVAEGQMTRHSDLPFNKAWVKQGVNWRRYQTIYIAPVRTDYLAHANWWQKGLRAEQMQRDVYTVANFMRTQFVKAFQNDPLHRFRVAPAPERGSLTMELALTELVPSNVLLDAVKIGGPYGSGLAAAILERATEAQSTVAFEGRLRDTNSGEILATFADREYAKVRPIDLKGLTWYGNAEDIIKAWSDQCVQIANRRPGQIVKPTSNFSLMPW